MRSRRVVFYKKDLRQRSTSDFSSSMYSITELAAKLKPHRMSSSDFSKQISRMSSDKLRSVVINSIDFQKEFVELAEIELLSRGVPLTQDEKEKIELEKRSRELEMQDGVNYRKFITDFGHNIVLEKDFPTLFSRLMIIVFSSLFSGFFGGIMMSYNLFKINKVRHIPIVLIVSIIMSCLMVWLLINDSSQVNIFEKFHIKSIFASNSLASLLIYSSLWWKYIGEKTKYRTKSIVIPLIFGIVIVIFFLLIFLK